MQLTVAKCLVREMTVNYGSKNALWKMLCLVSVMSISTNVSILTLISSVLVVLKAMSCRVFPAHVVHVTLDPDAVVVECRRLEDFATKLWVLCELKHNFEAVLISPHMRISV